MYYYKIDYFDDVDNKRRKESGITGAKCYGDAFEKVANYYGHDNVNGIYLEEWEDPLTEDTLMEEFERADVKED